MATLNLDPSPNPTPQLAVATIASPNPDHQSPSYEPPMGVPLPLPLPLPLSLSAPTHTHRRLPPPCWTPDETSVLIDAYRDKWYSLRRGNLRAAHWEDVASHIHTHCPHVLPPKTSVQCRHKMEKLRKRYRAELLRAHSIPHHRFSSSWVYFNKMDAMEKNLTTTSGTDIVPVSVSVPLPSPVPVQSRFVDDADGDDDDSDFTMRGYSTPVYHQQQHQQQQQQQAQRIRIAGNSSNRSGSASSGYAGFDSAPASYALKTGYANSYGTPNYNGERSAGSSGMGMKFVNMNTMSGGSGGGISHDNSAKKRKMDNGVGKTERRKEKGEEAGLEMVEAIRMLGEGFVKMEKMKMDMMRETERMRMEMEMKRTQMLLDSQHRIVEAFAKSWSDVLSDDKNDQDAS